MGRKRREKEVNACGGKDVRARSSEGGVASKKTEEERSRREKDAESTEKGGCLGNLEKGTLLKCEEAEKEREGTTPIKRSPSSPIRGKGRITSLLEEGWEQKGRS